MARRFPPGNILDGAIRDLEGFTGVGHSVEDCLCKARRGMDEHLQIMKEQGPTIPLANPDPTVTIKNEMTLEKTA
jgi:predicted RNase H-like HicB family nuclease